MLRALNHRKLGHILESRTALYRLEDPLTSSVFGPISHAPTEVVWRLLGTGARPFGESKWPAYVSGPVAWHFWPSWSPGRAGHNTLRVEPDVVLVTSTHVLILEMKHHGPQLPEQRAAQVSAARVEYANLRPLHVAVGGTHHGTLRSNLPCPSFSLPWRRLERTLERQGKTVPPFVGRIFQDASSALHAWGYRPRLDLGTLHTCHAPGQPLRPTVLDGWNPTAQRHQGAFDALVSAPKPSHRALATLTSWNPS